MKVRRFLVIGLSFLWLMIGGVAEAGITTITWHGHAAFEITTQKGTVLLIDPWLKNPKNPLGKENKNPIDKLKKVDYILVTHGHFDHIGDSVEIAKKTGARLVASFELGTNMEKLLGYPKDQMGFDTLMNIGGEITIAEGEVIVSMKPAVHSSGMRNPMASKSDPDMVYGGNPVGFVLRISQGPTIYHSGDTAFFQDMVLLGEDDPPDVALVNIGGHFGMEPRLAARAVGAVKARLAVPHHFGTFPILTQDAEEFETELKKYGIPSLVMKPGSSIVFDGKEIKK